MIRALKPDDIESLQVIHRKWFDKDFGFFDFLNGCSLVVTDDNDGSIVCAGGARRIAEIVMVTNKDYPTRNRRKAVYDLMYAIAHLTRLEGFNQIHAFIHDENWERHLIKAGFRPTSGKAMYLNL